VSEAITPAKKRLTHEWTLCAIAAAVARFVPVPFIDDVIREQAARVAVSRTLRAHGHTFSSKRLSPLYSDEGGCIQGCLWFLLKLPLKLLLYPIRKIVSVVTAIHGVPTDLARVLLLARTTDRCLESGLLKDGDDQTLKLEALRVRTAFDVAFRSVNLQMFSAAIADALSQVKGLAAAAVRFARKAFGERRDADATPLEAEPAIEEGARKVEEVLERPEIIAFLDDFDARFDAALAKPSV
jgi:hypothetical protein